MLETVLPAPLWLRGLHNETIYHILFILQAAAFHLKMSPHVAKANVQHLNKTH